MDLVHCLQKTLNNGNRLLLILHQDLLMYFLLVNLLIEFHFFHPSLFLESGTEDQTAFKGSFTPTPHKRVEESCVMVSEGSVAEESCDHSWASASSSLVKMGDLQGDVYQWSQHHLHKETTQEHEASWTGHFGRLTIFWNHMTTTVCRNANCCLFFKTCLHVKLMLLVCKSNLHKVSYLNH